ncbi:MAG: ABC transporter permease [Acidobacteria bacterium]|nr:ABC transporter permease [Acidobacteriota bacterium]
MSLTRRLAGPGMFMRLLTQAARLRRGQAVAAIAAVTVAAAAASAMLNLFTDVQAKLQGEFRKFGANVVVETRDGQSFAAHDLERINSVLRGRAVALPFAYVVARTKTEQPVVVSGTNLVMARQLNSWWAVSAWPEKPGEALVGVRAAKVLSPMPNRFTLLFQGHSVALSGRGTVQTGSEEDSRIYLSLEDFQSWTGLNPTVLEIFASGSEEKVSRLMRDLAEQFPSLDVRPVRQVREGEARVLGKTRSTLLFSATFIIATAALCVLATLTGWVFDRRHDFAIMKALGGSDELIARFVIAEASLLATVGALLGFAAGAALAAWIGRVNFHAAVSPHLGLLPPVVMGCLAVTLVATLFPLRLLQRIQPAMILRGE